MRTTTLVTLLPMVLALACDPHSGDADPRSGERGAAEGDTALKDDSGAASRGDEGGEAGVGR